MSIYNTTLCSTLYCLCRVIILYHVIMNDTELFRCLARNIKIRRVVKDLTQSQLAEMIGVHEKYIGVIESGKQNVTLKTLNKIANVLEVNISKLFEPQE